MLRRITGPVSSHLLQQALSLPAPHTRAVSVTRGLSIPVTRGRTLEADHWAPRASRRPLPTLLVGTPYGRGSLLASLLARPYAERGFQVLLTSLASTLKAGEPHFGSPASDREDLLAVVEWITRQDWFDGCLALTGPSYLGYVQWTVAEALPPEVRALVPQMTSSRLPFSLRGDGMFAFDAALRWCLLIDRLQRHGAAWGMLRFAADRLHKDLGALPVEQADRRLRGRTLPLYQLLVQHDGSDPFWEGWDFSDRVGATTVPVSLVAGWYDLFVGDQLRDYARLSAAGRRPRLTVGPWTHLGAGALAAGIRETLTWAGAHCRHEPPAARLPVRLYVLGGGGWQDFDQWPPRGTSPRPWYLRENGRLSCEPPSHREQSSSYSYDPARPTPAVGGALFLPGAGRRDNRSLERRADVLTFTSGPLAEGIEVIGEVTVQLWVGADHPASDLFVRLCDLGPDGRSWNVCDTFTRVQRDLATSAAPAGPVRLQLSPTASLFRRGHRLRVQISSGAYPRFARAGRARAHLARATTLDRVRQEIFHDRERPSCLVLPVLSHAAAYRTSAP